MRVGRLRVMALCRLDGNDIGPVGAAAISAGLASVPQLQLLGYVAVLWCV